MDEIQEPEQQVLPDKVEPTEAIQAPTKGTVTTTRGGQIHYEHKLIKRGGAFTAPQYTTHLWFESTSGKYDYGEFDGKLNAEEIESVFVSSLHNGSAGTQTSQTRRQLEPIRDRGKHLNPRTSVRAGYKPFT